jgi:DNA-binding transcriptional ArsR family regulator
MSGRGRLGDSWEGALLVKLLHPTQVAIIDALREAGEPLSELELVAATGARKATLARRIKHHLKRLRNLDAIELEVRETGRGRIRYRLTKRPGRGRR